MRGPWVVAVVCVVAAPMPAAAQDGSEGLPKLLAEADVHMRTHSWGAALKVLEQALALDAKNFDVRWKLGQCYDALDNPRAALDQYQAAAKLRPDDTAVAHRLGVALLTDGQSDKARPLLEKVYDADPETDGVRAALGRLYFESGDLTKARTFLKRAVRADRGNPELRRYYGETLFRLERYDEARDEFAVALEHARGKAEHNALVPIVSARQQLCQARIRTFGVIEDDGQAFRNKAFGVRVQKPEGWRWGWLFPDPLPALLVFQVGTEDGTVVVTMEAYSSSSTYTIGSRSVKPTELKPFFEAIEKDVQARHRDTKAIPAFRIWRQCRKQETVCLTGVRKNDLRKVDVQVTVGQVGQTTYRCEIVAAQGTFKSAKREIDALLQSITFDRD